MSLDAIDRSTPSFEKHWDFTVVGQPKGEGSLPRGRASGKRIPGKPRQSARNGQVRLLDGQIAELFVPSYSVKTGGTIPSKCLEAVEQVHHRAHQESPEAQPEHRAEDSLKGVLHRKGFHPQGSVCGKQFVRTHPRRRECDVVAVVELPAAAGEDPAFILELPVKCGPTVRRQN